MATLREQTELSASPRSIWTALCLGKPPGDPHKPDFGKRQPVFSAVQVGARKQAHFRRYEDHLELLGGQNVVDIIPIVYGRSKRIIRDEHYPAHERASQRTSAVNPLQAKFEVLAPEATAYLQGLTQSRVGTLREQMERIVALAGVHPEAVVSRAMQRALEYRAFGYGILKNIIKRFETVPGRLPELSAVVTAPLLAKLNVDVEEREPSYYSNLGVAKLTILGEVGYLTLDKTASDHLFQLVSRAYESVSLVWD